MEAAPTQHIPLLLLLLPMLRSAAPCNCNASPALPPPLPAALAQRYDLKVEEVQAANPQLDAATAVIKGGDIIALPVRHCCDY